MDDKLWEMLYEGLLCEDSELSKEKLKDFLLQKSYKMLKEIKCIIRNGYYNDREVVAEIVKVLEKYDVNCGCRKSSNNYFEID